jgi:hypothetical protein
VLVSWTPGTRGRGGAMRLRKGIHITTKMMNLSICIDHGRQVNSVIQSGKSCYCIPSKTKGEHGTNILPDINSFFFFSSIRAFDQAHIRSRVLYNRLDMCLQLLVLVSHIYFCIYSRRSPRLLRFSSASLDSRALLQCRASGLIFEMCA